MWATSPKGRGLLRAREEQASVLIYNDGAGLRLTAPASEGPSSIPVLPSIHELARAVVTVIADESTTALTALCCRVSHNAVLLSRGSHSPEVDTRRALRYRSDCQIPFRHAHRALASYGRSGLATGPAVFFCEIGYPASLSCPFFASFSVPVGERSIIRQRRSWVLAMVSRVLLKTKPSGFPGSFSGFGFIIAVAHRML